MRNFLLQLLFLYWTSTLLCNSAVGNLNKKPNSSRTQDVPSYYERLYDEWVESENCHNLTVRCTQGFVRQRGPSIFRMKAKIPIINITSLLKADIRMEFHNNSLPSKLGRRPYRVHIVPLHSKVQSEYQVIQDIVFGKSFVDMSFNITDVLLSTVKSGKNDLDIRLKLLRGSRRADEIRIDAVKAFLIIHEKDHICSQNSLDVSSQRTNSISISKKSPYHMLRSSDAYKGQCALRSWVVSTRDVEWEDFVVYPHVIQANRCDGKCFLPARGVEMSDHAQLKVSAYFANRGAGFSLPCCVPNSLGPFPMIVVDRHTGTLILQYKPNLVAQSCACL